MTTANTTAETKQALQAISIPATLRPVPIRPPDALPVHTRFRDAQQNHHFECHRIHCDIQKVSLMRILEHTENHDTQISVLKNEIDKLGKHLPTHKRQRCFRKICLILKNVEQVPKKIKKQVAEARGYLTMRSREIYLQQDISQLVSRMENKTPINHWLFEPENSDTSSSECAPSDYEQEQEDPEVAESFDQHGSSAPLSSTSGLGSMGEGEASLSECSETVLSEFCIPEKTPTPGAATPLSDSERSLALRVLMLLSTIDHESSPNYANPLHLCDEAVNYHIYELIGRYIKRLCERFKLKPRQPIPIGNALYFYAYEILGKALQSKGIRLEPLRLNMEVDDHYLDKELQNSELALSAVENGKLLADHGCYYDIIMDESPYVKISVKLSHFLDRLNKLKVQTVCLTAESLPTHRLQLQQLRSMPRSEEDCFKNPIRNLSALFEDIERSNNTFNRQIRYVRLQLYRGLSIMSDRFGLIDDVDDEHPSSESPSVPSKWEDRFKLLEKHIQGNSEKLDREVTESMKLLHTRLKENGVTNLSKLPIHIHYAQALLSERRQYLLHALSIAYHQQMLKWGESAIDECDQFLLEPQSGEDEEYEII